MVGRTLGRLCRSGDLREPLRSIRRRMRSWRRPYAVRKPAGWAVDRPGDLVQIDTVEIRPFADHPFKQFTARDVISRWDTLDVRRSATARLASEVLDALAARLPCPVRPIRVAGRAAF